MEWKYKQYIQNLAGNISSNPKAFWGFLKSKTKSKASPDIIIEHGQEYQDSKSKANILNQFFHSIFGTNSNLPIPNMYPENIW